jgi:hypothetical protein
MIVAGHVRLLRQQATRRDGTARTVNPSAVKANSEVGAQPNPREIGNILGSKARQSLGFESFADAKGPRSRARREVRCRDRWVISHCGVSDFRSSRWRVLEPNQCRHIWSADVSRRGSTKPAAPSPMLRGDSTERWCPGVAVDDRDYSMINWCVFVIMLPHKIFHS